MTREQARALNFALAALLALALAAAWLLDGPDAITTEADVADDLRQAIASATARKEQP